MKTLNNFRPFKPRKKIIKVIKFIETSVLSDFKKFLVNFLDYSIIFYKAAVNILLSVVRAIAFRPFP